MSWTRRASQPTRSSPRSSRTSARSVAPARYGAIIQAVERLERPDDEAPKNDDVGVEPTDVDEPGHPSTFRLGSTPGAHGGTCIAFEMIWALASTGIVRNIYQGAEMKRHIMEVPGHGI